MCCTIFTFSGLSPESPFHPQVDPIGYCPPFHLGPKGDPGSLLQRHPHGRVKTRTFKQHLLKTQEKQKTKREKQSNTELNRLATKCDFPGEVLLGMSLGAFLTDCRMGPHRATTSQLLPGPLCSGLYAPWPEAVVAEALSV